MDCYDTSACPGDCEGCEYYEGMLEAEWAKRQRTTAAVALACFVLCGLIIFVAAHLGGGR